LLLRGTLGVGKTVLAQGIAAGLGIDPKQVQSPSFTLVREHSGEYGRLVHIDLYRLEPSELDAIGIWEILESPGVKVVEWAERLPLAIEGALQIEIELGDQVENRIFTLLDQSPCPSRLTTTFLSVQSDAKGETE
jgi:tRNA threonylcarbamoyladenosine biosynthesis protein TsaE